MSHADTSGSAQIELAWEQPLVETKRGIATDSVRKQLPRRLPALLSAFGITSLLGVALVGIWLRSNLEAPNSGWHESRVAADVPAGAEEVVEADVSSLLVITAANGRKGSFSATEVNVGAKQMPSPRPTALAEPPSTGEPSIGQLSTEQPSVAQSPNVQYKAIARGRAETRRRDITASDRAWTASYFDRN
jgi:hypothetical protein